MPLARHICKNEYQDFQYGQGVRVVNPINKSSLWGIPQRYRCTVCGGEVDKSNLVKKV